MPQPQVTLSSLLSFFGPQSPFCTRRTWTLSVSRMLPILTADFSLQADKGGSSLPLMGRPSSESSSFQGEVIGRGPRGRKRKKSLGLYV